MAGHDDEGEIGIPLSLGDEETREIRLFSALIVSLKLKKKTFQSLCSIYTIIYLYCNLIVSLH